MARAGAEAPASQNASALLERARFLAEASRLLAQSLDYEATLATVARLAMPELGAWCLVDIVEEDGSIRRLAVAHPDPTKQALVRELERGYPPEVEDMLGAPAALRAHRSLLVPEVPDEALVAHARGQRHLEILRALGVGSYMVVPMEARGRLVGCITFVSAEAGRRYDGTDLTLADDLAARGAMAIDNARLFQHAEQARAEAEQARAEAEAARRRAEDDRDMAGAAEAAAETARQEAVAFGVRAHTSERARGDFLSTMSHEFRTPLNAVLGYAELLSAGVGGELSATQDGYLERLRAATRHLLGLVNDVLDVAKADAEGLPVARDTVDARAAMRAAVTLVQPQADARGIRLTIDWGRTRQTPGPARYLGDARRVEQIVTNLLTNAVKFTPPGGEVALRLVWHAGARPGSTPVPLAVALEAPAPPEPTSAPGWIGLRVADTGPGIAPADQARVFEPFVQVATGRTRPVDGTGLGLTISRRLARLMDGDVVLESEAGAGATFTLWLPAAAPESAAHAAEAVSVARRDPARGSGERRGAERYVRGLGAVGDVLMRQVDDIVLRYAERVRTDPAIPAARSAPWAEIANHTATMLSDVAQAPGVTEEAAGDAAPLMRIGDEIRHLVAQRHAQRRAQLGWSREGLERDFDVLQDEVEAAVRAGTPPDAAHALESGLAIMRKLLDDARRVGTAAFDREVVTTSAVGVTD